MRGVSVKRHEGDYKLLEKRLSLTKPSTRALSFSYEIDRARDRRGKEVKKEPGGGPKNSRLRVHLTRG